MPYPGITSDYTRHLNGAGTTNIDATPGMISALIASSANSSPGDSIVLHDSLAPSTDPRPLLTLYLQAGQPFHFARPVAQGLAYTIGLSAVIVGTSCSLHVTTHTELTP